MTNRHRAAAESAALTPISYRSADAGPREAFDMWQDHFGHLNDIIPTRDAPFAAGVDYWRVGRFTLANVRSSPSKLIRRPGHTRRDGFDHWVLRVSRYGVVRSRSGDHSYMSRPGDLVLEKLTHPYHDDWDEDEWVGAMFAPGVFPGLDRALSAMPSGPVPGARAALLADYLLALGRRLPAMTHADIDAVADATHAMIAALAPETRSEPERPTLAARLRAEQVIRANLGSARLDSRRIAALAGLSRSALYRLFEESGGVATHVRRIRLETVRAALSDPARRGERIAAIAEQAGFHCPASFSRAFRARFGVTPGEMRDESAAAPASPPAPAAIADAQGRDFIDVLLHGRGHARAPAGAHSGTPEMNALT